MEFKATKIYLNIRKLNLAVKLQNPNILISDNQIKLSKLDLFLSVKSFFSSDFLLQKAEIAFTKNDIKDLTKITNIFLPNIINNQLNNIFEKGYLDGEFVIPFKKDGSIGKDYAFSGKISEASINLTKDFQIKNLTTKIKHKTINEIEAEIIKGQFLNLELSGSKVEFKNENNAKKIKICYKKPRPS